MFETFSETFDGKIKLTTKSGSGESYFEAVAELPGDSRQHTIEAAWTGILKLQKDKLDRLEKKS